MTTSLPINIADIDKNGRERIRVRLDQFAGRNTVDVRIWYFDQGQWKPSKQGVTTSIANLPALAEGLAAALDRARLAGLVE